MKFTVPGFKGLVKVVAPQRLEPGQAVDALNCRLDSGDLVPYKAPTEVADSGSAATGTHTLFYQYYSATRAWFRWDTAVNVVRAPATDVWARLYYTGDGYPKVVDYAIVGDWSASKPPAGHRRLGVPAPSAAPTVAQPAIAGRVTISSIAFTVSGSSQSNLVAATAAHGLTDSDAVTFDYPGIDPSVVYRVKTTANPAWFEVPDLKLPRTPLVSIVRRKNTEPEALVAHAPAHGLTTGDVVLFGATGYGGAGNYNDQEITVSVIDGNRFYINGTEDTHAGDPVVYSVNSGFIVRLASAVGGLKYDLGAPGHTAYSGGQYTITTNGLGSTSQATSTAVAPRLRYRSYALTYVNGYGQEGPNSVPCAPIQVDPGITTATITWPTTGNPGARGDGTAVAVADLTGNGGWWVTTVRIYRTDELGNWRFLKDVAFSAGTTTDVAPDASLGTTLSTSIYIDPPDALAGLTVTPYGVLVGYNDKEVLASVPYQPHAWPLAYRVKVDYPIRGLVNTGAGIVVVTTGYPALLVGTDPTTWQLIKLEIPQACISPRSVVDMGEYALYASPDGLVAISQNTAKVVTEPLFNKAQWAAFSDSNMIGSFYEGKYYGSYGSGTGRKGFLFDPANGNFVRLELGTGITPQAFYMDLVSDTLYILGDNGKIYSFDTAATFLSATWESGTFQSPFPWSPAAGQVIAELGVGATLSCQLYADGVSKHTQSVTSEAPFRLPPNYRARDFKLVLSSTGAARVATAIIASTVDEVKQD